MGGRRPARSPLPRLGAGALVLAALLPAAWAAPEEPPDADLVAVPDVRRLSVPEAARVLEAVGLRAGRVYEVAAARLEAEFGRRWPLGMVVQQAPPPHRAESPRRLPRGAEVRLRVSAARDGPPEGRTLRPVPAPSDPRPESPRAVHRPPPPPPPPDEPAPPGASAPPGGPAASPREEGGAPAAEPPPVPEAGPPGTFGSPDAPAVAPPADPEVVPDLRGLRLADAEYRARASGMSLHVERVEGQPVGTVLEQEPAPRAPRPAGGVIRVVVAAGGDRPEAVAPAPRVEVTEIAVPDLLDRTVPQVERICEDLGLAPVVEATQRGPPGRVTAQDPEAGTVVPKETRVTVWVNPAAPGEAPVPSEDDASPPAPGPPGVPEPLAPAEGTRLGSERSFAIGFTWRPVPGAEAYVVEVEERGPAGWLPSARGVARRTALVLEIERLAPEPGLLRWRVRAVAGGRLGPSSAWVGLR